MSLVNMNLNHFMSPRGEELSEEVSEIEKLKSKPPNLLLISLMN